MTNPVIGIVVIFRFRTSYVDQCIQNLLKMEGGPWPLVIVPDQYVPEYDGLAIQVPRKAGISAKRNFGVNHLPPECTHVAFIDSDAYPRVDWLVNARARLQQADDSVAAICGPTMTPPDDSWSRKISGHALSSTLVMGPTLSLLCRDTGPVQPVREASTCNLIVNLETFRSVGGFDENLLTSEDIALVYAIIDAGNQILRDPQVVVFHHRRDLLHFWLQWFNEGLALRQRRKSKQGYSLKICLPSVKMLAMTALALSAFWIGTTALLILAALQVVEFTIFFIDRIIARVPVGEAFGAALAMWGFPKAYGFGGHLSYVLSKNIYVFNRNDPPATTCVIKTAIVRRFTKEMPKLDLKISDNA